MKYYIVRAGLLDLAFTSQAGAQKAMTVLMGAQELTRHYPDGYGEDPTLNMKPLELAYRTEDLRPAGGGSGAGGGRAAEEAERPGRTMRNPSPKAPDNP